MLRIYDVALNLIRELRPLMPSIKAHDPDIAKQLRRAANSVVLNVAEGSGCRAGNRRLRYETALGSAREVWACLDAESAWGDIDDVATVRAMLREIIGTLVNVTR